MLRTETLPLDRILRDPSMQIRAGLIDADTVADYAAAMREGAAFPPVVVFFDGATYRLADGFQRVAATEAAGLADIAAEIHDGTERGAMLHAVGANATHGLRRNRQTKENAVRMLLNDAEWGKWTDREIARQCNVSPTFVGTVRASLSPVDSETTEPAARTYRTKHGTTATMKTRNIGRAKGAQNTAPDWHGPGSFKTRDTERRAESLRVAVSRFRKAQEMARLHLWGGRDGNETAMRRVILTDPTLRDEFSGALTGAQDIFAYAEWVGLTGRGMPKNSSPVDWAAWLAKLADEYATDTDAGEPETEAQAG